ncbi:cation:proton antiporter, partial [Acidobacteria bacterium AH-259-D05]|nr:cation:proton antiporter [Acidobacteria bacterium AH-259-D05]
FGALISATDPVAVIALFKEMGAPKRLTMLVEGESLFNDGTALVLFRVILGVVLVGEFSGQTLADGLAEFVKVFTGGVVVGVLLGVFFAKIIQIVENDHLVEITLTTILALSAFMIAEHFLDVSGVMATVAAGLTMGSYGRTKISPPVHRKMESFWQYFAFICNSLIFLLVGLSIDFSLFVDDSQAIFFGALAVVVGRAVVIYTLFPVIGRFKSVERVSRAFQTIIFWGGA